MDFEKHFSLSFAYEISENVKEETVERLFWAMDRFYHDRADIDECAGEQRFVATQACAVELDRRNVAMRDPQGPKSYPGRCPPRPRA